jgi:signal peptidase
MKKHTSNNKQDWKLSIARWAWIPVLILLTGIYLLQGVVNLQLISASLRIYLFFPLLWILLALVALFGWKYGLNDRPRMDRFLFLLAAGAGLAELLVTLLTGIIWQFGYSPYSNQFPAILGNLFYMITMLVGFETARAYLLHRSGKKAPLLSFILILILFSFLSIPPAIFNQFSDIASSFAIFGKVILPALAQGMLVTYLALIGGPWMAITFRGIPLLFEWLSPYLPNLPWMGSAFIKTLTPLVILILINIVLTREDETQTNKPEKKTSYAWVVVALISVSLLWINSGLFGVRPFLVSGVSMEPVLKAGDIVIVQNVTPEEIAKGDIILFRRGSNRILHRVIETYESKGVKYFITQGDANNVEDLPVSFDDVEGKAKITIPKVGWISIEIKRALGWAQ